MKISRQVTIEQPATMVWPAMQDLSLVASCLPGAKLNDVDEAGVHTGTVDVRLGPASLSFAGKAELVNVDSDQRRMTIDASGKERRGRGGVNTTIAATVHAKDDTSTTIDVDADIDLHGPAAQFGRRGGILEDVSDELIEQFVGNLKRTISQGAVTPGSTQSTATDDTVQATDSVEVPATCIDETTGLWGHLATPGTQTSSGGWPVRAPLTAVPSPTPAEDPGTNGPTDNELSAIKFAARIMRRRVKRWVRTKRHAIADRRNKRKAA